MQIKVKLFFFHFIISTVTLAQIKTSALHQKTSKQSKKKKKKQQQQQQEKSTKQQQQQNPWGSLTKKQNKTKQNKTKTTTSALQ